MIDAHIQDQVINLHLEGSTPLVNGKPLPYPVELLKPNLYRVKDAAGNSQYVFVQQIDRDKRTATLEVNGKRTTVQLTTRMDKFLRALGMEGAMQRKLDVLKAPMPGLIHTIAVSPGTQVSAGDPLLILEAMKMENVIKSPGDGVVKTIHVREKDSVEKNALLISFGE